ncbi:Pectate lyase [Phytophthora infestans]|uniref:Probable pectate lyase F n=1 Tax=Phytophthora infestans TaxID=4787 RepID=A0A833SG83_PHYIN|nr:Pectate lyase [Phytophthora infestans]
MVNTLPSSRALAATATIASGASMRATAPMPTGAWPAVKDEFFDEPYVVSEVYDGKMKTSSARTSSAPVSVSGWQTAVFRVEPGGTLKNVIIARTEGVHCEQSAELCGGTTQDALCIKSAA